MTTSSRQCSRFSTPQWARTTSLKRSGALQMKVFLCNAEAGPRRAPLQPPRRVEGIQNPSEGNQNQSEQNQSPAERNPNPAERNPNLTSFHESSLSNGLSPTLTGSPAQIRRDALSSPREQKVNIRLTRLSRKCRLLRKAAPRRSGLPGAVAGISGKEARSRRPCAALR